MAEGWDKRYQNIFRDIVLSISRIYTHVQHAVELNEPCWRICSDKFMIWCFIKSLVNNSGLLALLRCFWTVQETYSADIFSAPIQHTYSAYLFKHLFTYASHIFSTPIHQTNSAQPDFVNIMRSPVAKANVGVEDIFQILSIWKDAL